MMKRPHSEALVRVAVALGAMAGASLRYGATVHWRGDHRVAILAVNVVGSFVLGVLTGLAAGARVSQRTQAFVGPGLCAAMTTFSTFAVDTVQLTRYTGAFAAAAYVAVCAIAGLGAAHIGLRTGRAVAR